MIGDSLDTDIIYGNKAGVKTCLVLSGNTCENKARELMGNPDSRKEVEGVPDFVMPYWSYTHNEAD